MPLAAARKWMHADLAARRRAHRGGREIVVDALARTGMLGHAARIHGSLWGGERQRVLLARALTQQPDLLVHTVGGTTLAVLHDLDLAVRSCDRLVVLESGRVVASGPVLTTLTPAVLSAVTERHQDGIVRVTCGARPLARAS